MAKDLGAEGYIDKEFPLPMQPFQPKEKIVQKATLKKGLHDRNPARAGVAHFTGAPLKLCIYDNSTITLFARRLS